MWWHVGVKQSEGVRAALLAVAVAVAGWLGADGVRAQGVDGQLDADGAPLTLVLGFPAGSGVDVVARLIQQPLAEQLGRAVVIDYKSGAAGNVASELVARARPDGRTLLLGTAATHGTNAALYSKLPFDVEGDFEPVGTINEVANVLAINPAVLDVQTVQQFVDAVRAAPGRWNFASTGNGTGTHMAFAQLNQRLGLEMVHVPYKGGPDALLSVLRGETCCIMNQVQTVLPHVQAGKLRLLGVTTASRVEAVADVAPLADSGVAELRGFESAIWFGLFAPRGTPQPYVQRVNAALARVLSQPSVRERMQALGNTVRIESVEQFRQTVRENRVRSAELVRSTGVRVD